MTDKKLILALKQWLNKEGNTSIKMASLLGYKSSSVIRMWLKRESIPEWQILRVEKILKKGTKNE